MWASVRGIPSEVRKRQVAFCVLVPEVADLATHHRAEPGPAQNANQDTPSLSPPSETLSRS